MHVLVDTCIWSQALRRIDGHRNNHTEALRNLISDNRAHLIGPIRQEILSGIRVKPQFHKLRTHLSAFPDLIIKTTDYECAAEFSNLLRSKGIQGSAIDFLICAVANRYDLLIYTMDRDFSYFKKHLPLKFYTPDHA
jgi:predicted nucleic acid-binding protein